MNDFLTKQTGLELNELQLQQLEVFFEMLVETNKKFNLTAITERQQVFEKHFLDSILGAVFLPQNAKLCDVGSGAGFPSVPLAVARPDLKITAVDSLSKRVGFLQEVAERLKLDILPIHSRIEDFAKGKNRESFDVVCARAVAPLNILLEYCLPLVKIGGIFLAYKTDEAEIEQSQNALHTLGAVFKTSKHFALPSSDKRCLLVFLKTKSSPANFPRGGNLPRKKPLYF